MVMIHGKKTLMCHVVAVALFLMPAMARAIDWSQAKGDAITLLFNAHPWTTAIEEHIAEFEQLTGIKVTLQSYPEDFYLDRMQLAVRSTAPLADVYFVSLDSVAFSHWSAGLMEPLEPYLHDAALTGSGYDLQDFPSSFRASAAFPPGYPEAQIHAIPISFETYMLFYNKLLVDEYLGGLVPQTMTQLVEAAQKVSQAGAGRVFGAVARGVRNISIFDTVSGVILNSWGAQAAPLPYNIWFDGDWSKPRANDPHIVEGLANYAALLKAGPANALALDWPETTQLFKGGRAAFYVDASVFGPGFEDAAQSRIAGHVGYSPLPPVQDGMASYSGQWLWALAIPKNSQSKKAAWLFIQWATSKEMDLIGGRATGGAARRSTWENPDFIKDINGEFADAVGMAMRTAGPTSVFREGWEEGALMVIDAIHDIYGGREPQMAAQKLQENMIHVMQ